MRRFARRPISGQDDEAFDVVGALDDFEPEPRRSGHGVLELMGVVACVGPNKFQPWKALADLVEDEDRAIAVLNASRMDDHMQRQASTSMRACILRPFTFLPAS